MSTSRLRIALSAVALAATALLAAGCAAGPSSSQAPTSSPSPDTGGGNAGTSPELDEVDATWLDDGRFFAIVTRGSSSCAPTVSDVAAEGQTVTVTLQDAEADACTDDLAYRPLVVGLPEGVDASRDVEVLVVAGDGRTDDVDLDGFAGAAAGGTSTEYGPSAGFFDDSGIVLLTWGSSSCPPVVNDVAMTGAGATVTFADGEGVCTMDMAPRATVITLPSEPADDDAPFELTLVGGGLDGTVTVPAG